MGGPTGAFLVFDVRVLGIVDESANAAVEGSGGESGGVSEKQRLAERVAGMSVKELKKTITEAGLSHADCFEKPELRRRAVDALETANRAAPIDASLPTSLPTSSPASSSKSPTRGGGSGGGGGGGGGGAREKAKATFRRRRFDAVFDSSPLGFGLVTSDSSTTDVSVSSVKEGGKAQAAGMRTNDRIVFVNGEDVEQSTTGVILAKLQASTFPLTITVDTVITVHGGD